MSLQRPHGSGGRSPFPVSWWRKPRFRPDPHPQPLHWQHVYEHGYVINAVDGLKTQNPVPWDRYAAAFDGSSFLQVHPLLKFFTLGIEYHHIHHLDIRVPGYSLQRCHDEAPVGLWDELGIVKLELADCWKSVFMTLWDEKRDVFVPFPPEEAPVLVTYMHMPPTHGHGHGHGHGAPRALSQTAPPT